MRIAIVHEWFESYAGSERVVEGILEIYPKADLFALVDLLPSGERSFIGNRSVTTSFIQRLPFAKRRFRNYLPLFPLAVEQFDLRDYDIVISSNHAVAKGVRTGPDQLHICMCHSPMRYAWDLQDQYLEELGLAKGIGSFIVRKMLHDLRIWDVVSSHGVDQFIANSDFVRRRIMKTYRRDAEIIYPPVAVDDFSLSRNREDFYLAVSRLVPYKRMAMIAHAFSAMPSHHLVIIGSGRERKEVESIAKDSPNITYMPHQPFGTLLDYMQRARAFVFAAKEDFGIIPLEAQACGTPVIAFSEGGAGETIQGIDAQAPSGVLFHEQTVDALQRAIALFERYGHKITPENCRRNAMRFRPEVFRTEFRRVVEDAFVAFQQDRQHPLAGAIQPASGNTVSIARSREA